MQAFNFHNLGGASVFAFCQNVDMAKDDKNGGPNHLQAWRERAGYSQQKLGELIGTTASVISYLEMGERGLSAKWLRKLAPALGTTPGMLLDHDPEELSADLIDMWSRAPVPQRAQLTEIAKTILKKEKAA